MLPTVIVEKWLNRLTEETFFRKLRWNGYPKAEGVFRGYAVEITGCEGTVEISVTKYVSSFGMPDHYFHKKIIAGDFLYQKAEELYQLARASADKNAVHDANAKVSELHAVLVG